MHRLFNKFFFKLPPPPHHASLFPLRDDVLQADLMRMYPTTAGMAHSVSVNSFGSGKPRSSVPIIGQHSASINAVQLKGNESVDLLSNQTGF